MRRAALYARVSSDRQAKDTTIQSQVEALREQARRDGVAVLPVNEYTDDGVSGATLNRPALDKLMDTAADGELDLLYVLAPDRLARKYAYQALLLEEFNRWGVQVVFLNQPAADGPEGELLVQVQGMIAEYEKAKILERSRRGKLHKARQGAVSVLSTAPYGYVYVRKVGSDPARLEILPSEAEVVQKMFQWYVFEHLAVSAIARRLTEFGTVSREGLDYWNSSTVWYMLKNPAYKGHACYGKTASVEPQLENRRSRLRLVGARSRHSSRRAPQEKWISIQVPAIVPESLFEAAQEQLEASRKLSQRNSTPGRYLLRGLLICKHCSYALAAITAQGKYAYYRCPGKRKTPPYYGACCLKSFHTSDLDDAVWTNLKELLQHPERVAEEHERRLQAQGQDTQAIAAQREDLNRKRRKLEGTTKRLLDAYEAGLLSIDELKPRKQQSDAALKRLHEEASDLDEALSDVVELREIVTHVADFASRLTQGLDELDFEQRQQLVRLLVKRVEASQDGVSIVYRLRRTGHG